MKSSHYYKLLVFALSLITTEAWAATFGDIPASLTLSAGTSVRRNAGNTLFEAFTPQSLTLGNLTDVGTDGITVGSGTGAVIGSGTTLSQHVADVSHNGYLSSTDWNTFNGKGSGSVTSIGLAGTSNQITVTGSTPITTSGSWTLSVPTLSQLSIAKITNLTSNGFVKTSGGDGTLGIDTTSYVPTTRSLAIAGTAQDLSADRTFTVPLSLGFTTDARGGVVTTGAKMYITARGAGTITGWSITATGSSPTCTIDVWKIASGGTALPTVTNTITASAKPALATGNLIRSSILTSWTTSFAAGDTFGFNVDAVTNATMINFNLEFTR